MSEEYQEYKLILEERSYQRTEDQYLYELEQIQQDSKKNRWKGKNKKNNKKNASRKDRRYDDFSEEAW
jgi:hypothetical protein